MGERKRVERFEDLIGSVERVIMTRATKVKGLLINREPFAAFFSRLLRPGTGRHEGRRTGTPAVSHFGALLNRTSNPGLTAGPSLFRPFRPQMLQNTFTVIANSRR
jgi:hypothetical protein